ncbi:MAG: XdhC/CoxI family protein [Actinomycetota bacterium]|nr:XdhC/CoxI family protein [Actinomycetota bacterium]
MAEHHPAGGDVVVATAVKVHGDPPCQVGQKIVVGRNGPVSGTLGCAEFDDAAIADAPEILESRTPAARTYTHDLGSVEVFLEPPVPRPNLVVVSATPVALNILRWGRNLGFEPVLIESRDQRVTEDFRAAANVVKSVEEVAIDSDTAAIHTDHDAPDVVEAVAALLRSPARFVGVMGSARHVGPHVERLREMGFAEKDVRRIRTPVGIDIGARTPEEIALSILAGVIAERRGGRGGWLDNRLSTDGA